MIEREGVRDRWHGGSLVPCQLLLWHQLRARPRLPTTTLTAAATVFACIAALQVTNACGSSSGGGQQVVHRGIEAIVVVTARSPANGNLGQAHVTSTSTCASTCTYTNANTSTCTCTNANTSA